MVLPGCGLNDFLRWQLLRPCDLIDLRILLLLATMPRFSRTLLILLAP